MELILNLNITGNFKCKECKEEIPDTTKYREESCGFSTMNMICGRCARLFESYGFYCGKIE